MSRVLARSMFKDQAPKQSGRGVGITSVVDDGTDNEEIDNRRERERMALELFEKNKDEMDGYQTFAQGERPQMFRQPATQPMPPQPNPQQMQAMQMQQMAAMGMMPRFAEGGQVDLSAPIYGPIEAPSAWSGIRQALGNAIGMRGRTSPMFARGSGDEIYAPPRDATMGSPAGDNPEYQFRGEPILPTMSSSGPSSGDPKVSPWLSWKGKPIIGWRESDTPEPPSSGRISDLTWTSAANVKDLPPDVVPPVFRKELPPPSEDRQDAMEADREARKGKALTRLPDKTGRDYTGEDDEEETDNKGGGGGNGDKKGSSKSSDLTSIKAEREAKQAALRQENIWLAMLQAGLAIAGGKSSNAITNIGQGGQAGLGAFITLEQQRRRDEDAAMRRDIAERELQLQTRRLNMQEPYIQAQTQYMLSKEGRDLAQLRQREYLAGLQAQRMAEQAWKEESKQMAYIGKKPEELAIARDIFLKNKTREFFKEKMLGLTPGVGAPASRETIPSSEE